MADGMGFDDALAICLDALDGGQGIAELLKRYPEHAEGLKPLLEAAAWFGGQAAALEPRPGFISASRKRLEQQIAAPPVASANWLQQTFGSLGRGWRVALQAAVVVVMLACLVMGSSGIAFASQNALPGDALFPVKLGLEQVELLVTLDPQENIRLHMQFSQLRLAEMQRLLALGRYDDLAIASANYQSHISQALRLLRALAAQNPVQAQALALELWVGLIAQADTLGVLVDIAPAAAQAELEAAEQAAQEGAQEAQEIGQGVVIPVPTEAAGGAPEAIETPTALPTATVEGFAVSSPTPTRTPSPTLPPTQTRTPALTNTPTQTPLRTATSTARPSGTIAPTATRTPQPTPTRTGQPMPTRTIPPTPTRTGQPMPTRTIPPTPTRTGQPTATRTTQPTPTRTALPSPTATHPQPTPTQTDIPTSTIAPTPTRTPRPTNTPQPTDTPEPSPYPDPGVYPPPHWPFN